MPATVKLKFNTASFTSAIHFGYLPAHFAPGRIVDCAPVSHLVQGNGSNNALMYVNHLGEGKICAYQFPVTEAPDNAIDTKMRMNRFFCIKENIPRKPVITFFGHHAFDPFTLNN